MERFQEEYVQINGITQYFLHYPAKGGCVVLFLHGGPGQTEAHLSYKTVAPGRNYSIVYYDQRGTGKTQVKNKSRPETITLEALVDDLKQTVRYIREKYPDKKLVLFGHSWGSILGMEYIKRYAGTVDAYVGMGQVVDFKGGEKAGYAHCFEMASEKDRKRLTALGDYPNCVTAETAFEKCTNFRKIQLKYGLAGYAGGNAKLMKIALKSPIFSFRDIKPFLLAMKTSANLMDCLLEYNTSAYTEFSVPLYFICGRNDWQVPSVLAEQYFHAAAAPDKELYWIEDAGHLTDLENPAAYNRALCAICGRVLLQRGF